MASGQERFEAVPCGMLEFQANGTITAANEYLCSLLGFTEEELRTMTFESVLTISSRIFHQTHFLPLLRLQGEAAEIYLNLRHKDETVLPMLTNAVLRQEEGVARVVCAFMPVHQREKYEDEILLAKRKAEEALASNEELQHSKRELESRLQELDRNLSTLERRNLELQRLGEILSHDLREPVRKIETFAEILAEEEATELSSSKRTALERINAACGRMNLLLKSLQEFVWIDSDPEEAASVDLNVIVNEAERRLRSEVEVTSDSMPVVFGFGGQLTTLFEYLFQSAVIRAHETPARVRITCLRIETNSFRKLDGKYRYIEAVQISVEDDGTGFSCTDCDSFFQLLRKTGGVNSHPDFAICKKIVDNHHGSISLRSPGKLGALFNILLPIHAPDQERDILNRGE